MWNFVGATIFDENMVIIRKLFFFEIRSDFQKLDCFGNGSGETYIFCLPTVAVASIGPGEAPHDTH